MPTQATMVSPEMWNQASPAPEFTDPDNGVYYNPARTGPESVSSGNHNASAINSPDAGRVELKPDQIDSMMDDMFARSRLLQSPAPEVIWDVAHPGAVITDQPEPLEVSGGTISDQSAAGPPPTNSALQGITTLADDGQPITNDQPLTITAELQPDTRPATTRENPATRNASSILEREPEIESSTDNRADTIETQTGGADINGLNEQTSPVAGQPIADRFKRYIPFTIQGETPSTGTAADSGADDQSSRITPIPTLQARQVEKSRQRQEGVPVSNASHRPKSSRAKIVPDSETELQIPASAVQPVPAVGPQLELLTFPGFPGIPVPKSGTLEPRSAQPQSGDVMR